MVRVATVTRIIDGDTFEVQFQDDSSTTIRLVGVDTPEVEIQYMDPAEYNVPDTPAGRDWLLQWGGEASAFAEERLAGEQVRVATDPQAGTSGGFGRTLAYIYHDDTSFGKQLLNRGLARVYTGETFVLEDEYLAIEADAQAANQGVWGFERPTTPTTTSTPDDGGNDDNDNDAGAGVNYPPPSNDGAPGDKYDCGDFDDPAVAQQWFETHNPEEDPSGLDGDGNGQACE